MHRALPLLVGLCACSAQGEQPEVWLIDSITLQPRPKPTFAYGFDLDGVVSPEDDPDSCGHGDVNGMDGTPGVDNQFSALLPAMELVAGEAVHALVQEAIDSGVLLVTLTIDSPGSEVTGLAVARAEGPGLTGADGRLIGGQTLQTDDDLPGSRVDDATYDGESLQARGITMDLPLSILGYELPLTLYDGAVSMEWEDESRVSGQLGGLISVDQMQPSLDYINTNGDPQIAEPVRVALDSNADVQEDGTGGDCEFLSISVAYTAVPAWIYQEAE